MEIIRQRHWTEQELRDAGFHYITRRKQRVLAGRLPQSRAPLTIDYKVEKVFAESGDVICFDPGEQLCPKILDYNHWSVKPDIFRSTYQKWDEPQWSPTPAETHLIKHGCRPYFKYKGAWAKQLHEPAYVQSIESPEPVLLQVGEWVLIGEGGDPWNISEDTLLHRYILPVVLRFQARR